MKSLDWANEMVSNNSVETAEMESKKKGFFTRQFSYCCRAAIVLKSLASCPGPGRDLALKRLRGKELQGEGGREAAERPPQTERGQVQVQPAEGRRFYNIHGEGLTATESSKNAMSFQQRLKVDGNDLCSCD